MNNLFLSAEYHNTTNNVVQSVLTPPDWFTELHSHAPQTAGDVGYGSLDSYCEVSVPPHALAWDRGAETSNNYLQLNHLRDFINEKTNIVNVRHGIDKFKFKPNLAKKSLQKTFSYVSPIASLISNDENDKAEISRKIRNERSVLLKVSKALLVDNQRRAYCQSVVFDVEKGVGVYYNQENKKASFGGYQSCGSPTCPHCGNKIALANESEIKKAIEVCKEKGYDYSLFTNTIRHKRHHTLVELLDFYSKIFEVFRNSKPYRKMKRLGYLGDIKALETPHSDNNGWHPHYHTLMIFNRLLTDEEKEFCEKKLISAWLTACSTVIERDQLNPHDLMPERDFIDLTFNKGQIDDTLGEYMTKQGVDTTFIQFKDNSEIRIRGKEFMDNPKWGVGKELTRGNSKRSRGESVTPNDMLRLIAGEIDNEDDTQFNKYAFLYREFVTAMTGRSMLRWTPKLRQRLFGDDYEEQSDQEKADYLDENSEQILSLSTEQEKAIRKFNSESHFLRLIEKNHDTGGIDTKGVLDNMVGLYRAELDKKPEFDFNKIDMWINGQLFQVPKLYETLAPCELKSS